jgi:hypothetical protein
MNEHPIITNEPVTDAFPASRRFDGFLIGHAIWGTVRHPDCGGTAHRDKRMPRRAAGANSRVRALGAGQGTLGTNSSAISSHRLRLTLPGGIRWRKTNTTRQLSTMRMRQSHIAPRLNIMVRAIMQRVRNILPALNSTPSLPPGIASRHTP